MRAIWAGLSAVVVVSAGGCASEPRSYAPDRASPAFGAMRTEAVRAQPVDIAENAREDAAALVPAQVIDAIYGDARSTWWSVQSGVAFTSNNTGVNGRLSLHHFVADDFEVNGSLGGWGHFQDGDDEASIAFDLGFRWHFINEGRSHADGLGMTVYADTGIGMLYATGEVPSGGTRYNFTPRAGLGATWPIGDGPARLDAGVRWQHLSNASTAGSDDNPSRDAAMVYLGVILPF